MTRSISALFISFFISFTAFAHSVDLQGKFEQGSLIRGKVPANSQVFLNGKKLLISPGGDVVFGFGRQAEARQMLKVIYPEGLTELKPLTVKARTYKIDRVNGISKNIMKPEPRAVARAKKEAGRVRASRGTQSTKNAVFGNFIWPVTGRISGVYGSQRVYNGKPGRPHYGVDVARVTGTPVVSPADGVITLAVADMFYSGGTVIIDHGYGVSSSMLHLSKLYVKEGQSVRQGEKIAEIGATGRVTGPHLDWRLNWFQMRLDPTSIVPDMKSVLKTKNE